MRNVIPLLLLFASAASLAAEPRIHRNIPYFEPAEYRRSLDVYNSIESKNAPVFVWIHGGGWQRGDKTDIAAKPWAFVDKGFVFVALNYRFYPKVTMKQIAEDVAKAVGWTYKHAKEYGGDPRTMFLGGHSAGASLTALVCTDERLLKAEGVPLSALKGCVPVDGDAFDVPMQIKTVEPRRAEAFGTKFGGSESSWKELSAVTYIDRGKSIPPFLILRVADPKGAALRGSSGSPCCPETDVQAERLSKALTESGIPVKIFAAENKNHTTLDAELGLPDDKATAALFEFLSGILQTH